MYVFGNSCVYRSNTNNTHRNNSNSSRYIKIYIIVSGAVARQLNRSNANRMAAGSNPRDAAGKLGNFLYPTFNGVFRRRH